MNTVSDEELTVTQGSMFYSWTYLIENEVFWGSFHIMLLVQPAVCTKQEVHTLIQGTVVTDCLQ